MEGYALNSTQPAFHDNGESGQYGLNHPEFRYFDGESGHFSHNLTQASSVNPFTFDPPHHQLVNPDDSRLTFMNYSAESIVFNYDPEVETWPNLDESSSLPFRNQAFTPPPSDDSFLTSSAKEHEFSQSDTSLLLQPSEPSSFSSTAAAAAAIETVPPYNGGILGSSSTAYYGHARLMPWHSRDVFDDGPSERCFHCVGHCCSNCTYNPWGFLF